MSASDTPLSRASLPGFGKCTEPLKTMLPFEVKAEFEARSRELGYDGDSDCLRDLVIVWLRGADEVAKLHAERVRKLSITGTGLGQ